jgi:signal transduction histidine kinase
VISHDLRNPLDVAKAHLQAARETGDPEHFESVTDAHDRMERIIRDALTLTRGNDAVDPSDRVSIETAATDAWRSVDTGGATLDLDGSLPVVTADADRVRRLFENLFRNSVEHGSTGNRTESGDSVEGDAADDRTGPGESAAGEDRSSARGDGAGAGSGLTITVGTLTDGIYVADDGTGVPADERETVFEPGHSSTDGGTGLGLAIVDRIIAAHDWDVTLTTADGGGARFEIRF